MKCISVALYSISFLFTLSLFGMNNQQLSPYVFNGQQLCESIDKASTFKNLVPIATDLVRLLDFAGNRVVFTNEDYEYFVRDWDAPIAAATGAKTLHQRLLENIESINEKSFKNWQYCGDTDPKKAQLELADVCRIWLSREGHFSILNILYAQSEKHSDEVSTKKTNCAELKKALLSAARDIRACQELTTRGMNSFIRYMYYGENVGIAQDEARASAFCMQLSLLINEYLDAYGVISENPSFSCDLHKQFYLSHVKDILKDSVVRFHALLMSSFREIDETNTSVQAEKFVQPFLRKLTQKQCNKREKQLEVVRYLLAEDKFHFGQTGERRPLVKSVAKKTSDEQRPPGWHPPSEDELVIEKEKKDRKAFKDFIQQLRLIDEVIIAEQKEVNVATTIPHYALPTATSPFPVRVDNKNND